MYSSYYSYYVDFVGFQLECSLQLNVLCEPAASYLLTCFLSDCLPSTLHMDSFDFI